MVTNGNNLLKGVKDEKDYVFIGRHYSMDGDRL